MLHKISQNTCNDRKECAATKSSVYKDDLSLIVYIYPARSVSVGGLYFQSYTEWFIKEPMSEMEEISFEVRLCIYVRELTAKKQIEAH